MGLKEKDGGAPLSAAASVCGAYRRRLEPREGARFGHHLHVRRRARERHRRAGVGEHGVVERELSRGIGGMRVREGEFGRKRKWWARAKGAGDGLWAGGRA